MARVKVYSTGICPICDNTKNLLKKWHIPYDEARVDRDRGLLQEMLELTQGSRYVPQIAIDGQWIGGFSALTELHMEGKLDALKNSDGIAQAS
ncbi:MAG: glutaredoxin [Gammaproteobacteria bacterium]|nr:glutaredoxin [Gammaproteobacteria bacterium]